MLIGTRVDLLIMVIVVTSVRGHHTDLTTVCFDHVSDVTVIEWPLKAAVNDCKWLLI